MSLEAAREAFALEAPRLIPHFEMIDDDVFLKRRLGIDAKEAGGGFPLSWWRYAQGLGFDFSWNICEMPMAGRSTNMGHAVWSEGAGFDDAISCPFGTIEEVLAFDPVEECGMPPLSRMVEEFRKNLSDAKDVCPDVLVPGGRYHSVFSNCIRTFGWEMFLISVPGNEEAFARVIEGFARIAIAEAEAWAETDAEVYITHDDIVWTSGAIFHPEWYRKYIFPWYGRIWEPLKSAGKKVIFCADGNWMEFADDIAAQGADGFIFEPCTSLEAIAEKYGKTHVIMGNADCRILQFGSMEDIKAEVDRCIRIASVCPGYFMLTSNHLAAGIPQNHIDYYLEYFEQSRIR